MKITTLVENTVTAGLAPVLGEHGLSFHIRANDKEILFDTGQGRVLLENADLLGIDLTKIDTVVLSHGHYDHAGGLTQLMTRNSAFTLVGHPDIFDEKWVGGGGPFHAIGIAKDKASIRDSGIKMRLEKSPVIITKGVQTTGEVPMCTDFEAVEAMFFTGSEANPRADQIPDDGALILDTAKGTVVVLGCAHRGIVNTLKHVTELTGRKKIHAVMGGLHLWLADPAKLEQIVAALTDFAIDLFIVGHCTGFKATHALVRAFGDKVIPNIVGQTFEF